MNRTQLKLKITSVSVTQIVAIFDFYYEPKKISGKYYVNGRYYPDTGILIFEPGKWIKKPKNYKAIGLEGTVSSDGKHYIGRYGTCFHFELIYFRFYFI